MDFLATPRRRRVLFVALYVSEGAPIGFIWWALPTWLRTQGVSVPQITALTATLVLPWALKWVWAPLVDVLRGPRWSYRHWIIAAQLLMALSLVPLLWIDPAEHLPWLMGLLLAHALAASTQDAAVDALAISHLSPDERGRMNGWMQAGMLFGRALLGGGALLLAAQWGWTRVLWLLLAVILCSLLLLFGSREAESSRRADDSAGAGSFGPLLLSILRRPALWIGLAFALTAGAVFESVGSVAGPMLIDRGHAEEQVGLLYALPIVVCLAAGALFGGYVADRCGRRGTIIAAQLLMIASVGWLVALETRQTTPAGVMLAVDEFESAPAVLNPAVPDEARQAKSLISGYSAALLAMYLGTGIFTAASYALLMDLTSPQLKATQFSAFMGATNGCEALAGYATGQLVKSELPAWLGPWLADLRGYQVPFLVCAAVSVMSLSLLWAMPSQSVGQAGS